MADKEASCNPRRDGPRDRLLHRTGRLFAERGPDGVTIREVAAAANVQLSDIYRHFPDLQALYAAVRKNLFDRQSAYYAILLTSPASPRHRLLRYAATLYRDFVQDSRFMPFFSRALLNPRSDIVELVDEPFLRQFHLAAQCAKELASIEQPELTIYSLYALTLGHAQMAPFRRAVIRDRKSDDAIAMARSILSTLLPTIPWSRVRVQVDAIAAAMDP